ncbi:MAG: hypothetical protein JXA42_17035 [Anaerolineales bacterium]|nr:hypothetical protein [Anaerolineales bacterium]
MPQRIHLSILIALAVLALSGCSFVSVINDSEKPVTIMVKLPDRSSNVTINLPGKNVVDLTSGSSGTYSVRVFSQEAYKAKIKEIGNAYSPLFDETRIDNLGDKPTEPWQASWTFTNQEKKEEPAEFPEEASCYGNMGENAEVTATITWHEQAGVWFAECSSDAGNGIDWLALFGF